jgi:beta-1,4-mannooligosaccharide phosphorylase
MTGERKVLELDRIDVMKKFLLLMLATGLVSTSSAEAQTLNDIFRNKAKVVVDIQHAGFGATFGMHFLTDVRLGGTNYAYYIGGYMENGVPKYGTNLATTTNGIHFNNLGPVLRPSLPRDARIASFASVYKDGSKWYMAYEAASLDGSNLGDIMLATSSDGINWKKNPNPILRPTRSWERANVGTPTILKYDGTWYLFYHGFDFVDVQVGLATGSSLTNLVKANSGEPILRTGGGWDAGTVGKRSITRQGDYWYMCYEGSTDQVNGSFSNARWSSGLARSTDLVNWEKYPANPILPQTRTGFGYDGPEWFKSGAGELFIYFRNTRNSTDRARVVWK